VATTLHNLAHVYELQGKYGEAEGLYKRALAITEKAKGTSHPDVAPTLANLAIVHELQGKYGEAEGLYKRALAITEKAKGTSHPDVAPTLNNLALLYRAQGKYSEAEGLFKRALAIREQAQGASHPDVAQILHNLAYFSFTRSESTAALAYSRKSIAAVLAHRAIQAPSTRQAGATGGLVEQRASYFRRHVSNLAEATRQGIDSAPALAREAVEVAQWASQSSAAAAVQQMSARFGRWRTSFPGPRESGPRRRLARQGQGIGRCPFEARGSAGAGEDRHLAQADR
jgi:Tfp pilus assembly protein PilF